MLYETLSQPLIALILIVAGFFSAIFFDIANVLLFNIKSKKIYKIFKNILDCCCVLLCGSVFYIVVLFWAYGDVRLWQIILFILAVCIERVTIGKLIAKIIVICYNNFIKFMKFIKKKIQNIISKNKNLESSN